MIARDALLGALDSVVGLTENRGPNHNFITDWYADLTGYEWARSAPWCAMTETWALHQAGVTWFVYAYCPFIERDARAGVNGMSWTRTPTVGSLAQYDIDGVGYAQHTGTVTKVFDNGTFEVIEGNWASACYRLVRNMKYVRGFAVVPLGDSVPALQPQPFPYTQEGFPMGFIEDVYDNFRMLRGIIPDPDVPHVGGPPQVAPFQTFEEVKRVQTMLAAGSTSVDPKAIAQAIKEGLPADLAKQVVKELAAALKA